MSLLNPTTPAEASRLLRAIQGALSLLDTLEAKAQARDRLEEARARLPRPRRSPLMATPIIMGLPTTLRRPARRPLN